jgi:DNA-binding transcriptional regulator YhcF (GntR family)
MNNEFKKMQKLAGLIKENQDEKMLDEGDFDTANNVMAVINQLLEMGDEGERVLAILERIPEWNELVSDNQDIDM